MTELVNLSSSPNHNYADPIWLQLVSTATTVHTTPIISMALAAV